MNWNVANSPSVGVFYVYAFDGTYHYLTYVAATGAGSYTYNWTVAQAVGTGYVIRVWYVDGGGNWLLVDDSAPTFAISGSSLPSITVTAPATAGIH